MRLKVLILPFHPGDTTREFDWEAPAEKVDAALEEAFREFNVVEEGDPHIDRECRSMSVGDVIQAEGKTYICATAGWKEIPAERIESLKGMTFSERHRV